MAEYIEVLNENGVFTGETKTRQEIHADGNWHRAVIVAIIDSKNRILLQQRSFDKDKFPGKWDISIAAHVMSGEDPMSTIVRETNEEIGFQIDKRIQAVDFRFITSFRNQLKISEDFEENQFYDVFILNQEFKETQVRFNDSEVIGVKWHTYTEIQELIDNDQIHPRTEWLKPIFKYLNRF